MALLAACSASSYPSGTRATAPTAPRSVPRATTPRTRGGAPHAKRSRPLVAVVPRYIDATGHKDVQKILQAFIAGVPNGTTIEFRAGGKYRLERTLWIRNRRRLTFDGNGATIFATQRGARDRSQIRIKRGARIVFRDLNVRGVNPHGGTSREAYVAKFETQHAFRFESTQGAELDHVHVTDVYGDFVYLGLDRRKKWPCRNVWIHDSTFARNGRQGIGITAAENVIIERNHFNDTRRSTIDLEPGFSGHVSNVFILHNAVGNGRLLFVASHGAGPVNDIVISGNVLHGHALSIDVLPPEGKRRSNWVVTDNVSDTVVHGRPMRFFSIDGLVVKNNTQEVTHDVGVVLTDDCGIEISGNHFGDQVARRSGPRCAAAVAMPSVPAIPGRGAPPTTLPPGRPPTSRPGSTRPGPTGPGPGPTSGSSDTAWVVSLVAAGVLLAAGGLWVIRRRRRGAA